MNKEEIPTIDLKMTTKEVKGKMIKVPYIVVETPEQIIKKIEKTGFITTIFK